MNKLKIILAFDSFKNCMASYDVCRIVRDSMLENAPDWNVLSLPLGDGGEGTARAISSACGGKMERITVKDPLFRDVDAEFAVLPDGSAVFEMASASGIELIGPITALMP
ncbi:MAG: glycerate kinase [Lentisphaeria bacterium]|nr:glycerate kinase [Lentisphaeria bacterium]